MKITALLVVVIIGSAAGQGFFGAFRGGVRGGFGAKPRKRVAKQGFQRWDRFGDYNRWGRSDDRNRWGNDDNRRWGDNRWGRSDDNNNWGRSDDNNRWGRSDDNNRWGRSDDNRWGRRSDDNRWGRDDYNDDNRGRGNVWRQGHDRYDNMFSSRNRFRQPRFRFNF